MSKRNIFFNLALKASSLFASAQKAKAPPSRRRINPEAVLITKRLLKIFSYCPLVETVSSLDVRKMTLDGKPLHPHCASEDGRLVAAILSPPTYLDWDAPICEAERLNQIFKPDQLEAIRQWTPQISTLIGFGVKIYILKPDPHCPEAVFTRDILFVIDDKAFAGRMVRPERQAEQAKIVGALQPDHPSIFIEGGNVVLGPNAVYLGIGDRTNREAAEWLQHGLGTSREVVQIALKPGVLHLDCVFCPIERNRKVKSGALVYSPAFENPRQVEQSVLSRYGTPYELSADEYNLLGPNLIKLDRGQVLPTFNKGVLSYLRKLGIWFCSLDYSQMIKAGGSFRCTYAALARKG